MTNQDLDGFSVVFKHLGQAFGKAIDSDLLMDAFRDLQEFPLATVEQGLEKLRRTCRFFPRPAQLIDACRECAHVNSQDGGMIPAWVDHIAEKYICTNCLDTGYVRALMCDGNGTCRIPGCGKADRVNSAHDYTRKCSCRSTNPWLAQERAKMRRSPEEVR